MKQILVIIGFLFLLSAPNWVNAAAYGGDSFCITTYDGFRNLKDEFVFARTGVEGNYEYYKKPAGNLYLEVPFKTEKVSFLITEVNESGIEANTFRGNKLSDFSEVEQSAIKSGLGSFSKIVEIRQKDSQSEEFLSSCHKLSLDAKRGWLYPHNLLNRFPLLLLWIFFFSVILFAAFYFIRVFSKK